MIDWKRTRLDPDAHPGSRSRLLNVALVATGLMLAIVLGALWTRLSELVEARSWLLDTSSQLLIKAIDFESEIGFGGFIHNFKNAVLRPTELYYLVAAEENLYEAIETLDSLEGLARALDSPLDLKPLRDTLEQYARSIEILRAQETQMIGSRELDALVRVQNIDAMDSLARLVDTARLDLMVRIEEIRFRIQWLSDGFAIAAALLATLMLFLATKRRVDTVAIQDLAGRRAEYLLDQITEAMITLSADRRILCLNSPARSLLDLPLGSVPCAWPDTITLEPRFNFPPGTAREDLLAEALKGRTFRNYPAIISRSDRTAGILVRLSSSRAPQHQLDPAHTIIFLLKETAIAAQPITSDDWKGHLAAES